MLTSCLCVYRHFETDWLSRWASMLNQRPHPHRKQWEYCFIMQALFERGLLSPGKTGIGFGCGPEPLPAIFAAHGCRVIATDLACPARAEIACLDPQFADAVTTMDVDMAALPEALPGAPNGGFDFLWSACAVEHIGSMPRGVRFIREAMRHLAPRGWAVHTTEFNVSSNGVTADEPVLYLYRRCDIEWLMDLLSWDGHLPAAVDFDTGDHPFDRIVDRMPWHESPHLKLECHGFVATSIALIIQKAPRRRTQHDPLLRQAREELLGTRHFLYRRASHGERLVEILADGTFGIGRASLEERWRVVDEGRGPELVIYGREGVTCRAALESDGAWRGRWLLHQQLSVELVPHPQKRWGAGPMTG